MTTWSNARDTLGQGTPQEGAGFDNSAQLRQMQTTVVSAAPGDKWTGTAADGYAEANSKQARVLGQMAGLDQRLGAEVDRSAAVVAAGRQNLDGVKQWVLDAAAAVPQSDQREQQLLPIARKGIGDVADVVKQTHGDLNAIGGRIQAIGNEYKDLGDPNDKDHRDNIVGDKNDDPNKSKKQAQKDVEAALSGSKDASGRVANVLNTIDGDQLAGKKPLTPLQASYLSQMQAQQNGMSVYALKNGADKGAGGIIADSWQLMSNPNVKFPQTELKHGALDDPSKMVSGGFAQLPREVQNAIQSPGFSSSDDMQKIGEIVHGGNSHFQTNTDLDRGMIHKAADMMNDPAWKATSYPPGSGPHFGEPSPEELHRSYDQSVSSVLSAVSPDHQVVHDALTGHVDNPNNDPYKAKFGVDGTQFLQNLTHEAWDDKGAAAGSLFDWTNKAATGPEAQISAETAHAYSHYVATHEQDLLKLSGTDTPFLSGHHSLGEVNPQMVQGMATGLTPYMNNIAGLTGGLPGFGDVGQHAPNDHLDINSDIDSGTLPNAKGLFSVLNSDPKAAQIFDGAAYQQALLHEQAFAQDPGDSLQPTDLYDSATLRGLVDSGTHNAMQAAQDNKQAIAMDEYQWKKAAYDFGLEGIGAIPGAPPGIGMLGHALESNMLGPPPEGGSVASVPQYSIDRAEWGILNAMAATGQPIENLPPHYFLPPDADHPYPRIADAAYMKAHFNIDTDRYSQDVGQALAKYHDQALYLRDRHNAVIDDTAPQRPKPR